MGKPIASSLMATNIAPFIMRVPLTKGIESVKVQYFMRDEGIFYGIWSEGKKVFEGKRWLTNDTHNCYREIEVWATGPITASDKKMTDWIIP